MKKDDALSGLEAANEMVKLLNDFEDSADWHKDVLDAYTKLAQATGIVPRDSDPYGPLDFVAKILYSYDCATENKAPTRWSGLPEQTKERFRAKAIQTVGSWASEELQNERLLGMQTGRLVPRR
jgi:hypothetical protein